MMGRVGVKDKKKTAHFNKKSQRIDTKVQLKELKATPTGRALVNQLVKSKNVFRIVEGKGSSSTKPDSLKDASNGKGTGATITHDQTATPKAMTTNGEQPTPPAVVLGHELSHAAEGDKGTISTGVSPFTGNPNEEDRAVNDENKIRREMGLPERRYY